MLTPTIVAESFRFLSSRRPFFGYSLYYLDLHGAVPMSDSASSRAI